MTREEKIAAIILAMQDDAKLITLMRILLTNNINNIDDFRLDALLLAMSLG